MGRLIINDFSYEEYGPVLSVGLSESSDEGSRDFIFQCDQRHNSCTAESNWLEGETYCVTDSWGRTSYSKGVPGNQLDEIGISGVNALKQQAIAWAKEDGIATIILPGKRHTPGKPRRDFKYVLDVASGRLRKG